MIKDYADEPILLFCSADKIQQALMALLINSIEASPDGGNIKISISQEINNVVIRSNR